MAEIIKARVWQKVDTEANWNANPLILGPGEFAPVLTAVGGSVFNFKVGTGDRRFSDLPWSLQNPGAAIAADTNTVFPTDVPGLYIPTESGTYNPGAINVDLTVGYVQLIWDGSTLVKVEFPIDLSGYLTTSDIDGDIEYNDQRAVVGDKIYKYLPGKVPSKNIFDGTFMNNRYVANGTAVITAGTGWKCSNYMPVSTGEYYISALTKGRRGVGFYDSDKNPLRYDDTNIGKVTVQAGEEFMVINLESPTATGFTDVMVAARDKETPYVPYGDVFAKEGVEGVPDALQTANEALALAEQAVSEIDKQLLWSISSGGTLVVNKPGFGFISGQVANSRGYSGNNMFNFAAYNIMGVNVSVTDDVAPIHAMNTTIGANHGHPHQAVTIISHGLTNADIGTVFTQPGKSFVLMRIISADQVAFIGENVGTPENPDFETVSSGTITRGAQTFTIADRSSIQMYPSIKGLSVKVYADGKEVSLDGSGQANQIDVVEEYQIKSIDSIIENAKGRGGSSADPTFDGDGFIMIKNVYRFTKQLACVVYTNTLAMKEMAFSNIMVTQAHILGGTNDGTVQYYVPNSAQLNSDVDLRTPTAILWSSSIQKTMVEVINSPDPNNPPNRVIQYKGNVGFMIGYLPKGVGDDLPSFTENTFEIRNNTGKVYPHPVESGAVGTTQSVNDAYSVVMYRAYCDLTQVRSGNRLSIFRVHDYNHEYVFIDYSGSMRDLLTLDESYNGKKPVVVESSNVTVLTDVYNSGMYLNATYVSEQTCYIVLRFDY